MEQILMQWGEDRCNKCSIGAVDLGGTLHKPVKSIELP
jgi:hypothetical protein